MANYTIELRRICDLYGEDNVKNWFYEYNIWDYLTEDQVRDINHYNVWSPERLARKIIDHYYFREIGFETPGMFHHFAKVKMQELMEKYLPIIWSTTIEYNPLHNVDYTETYERNTQGAASDITSRSENVTENRETENSGTSSSSGNDKSTSLQVNSDTPQR